MTRYRLVEALLGDLGVYFNAFWLKIRAGGAYGLLRIPPLYMVVQGGLVPTNYKVTLGGQYYDLAPDQVVHFRGYSRRIRSRPLAARDAAQDPRRGSGDGRLPEYFWANRRA